MFFITFTTLSSDSTKRKCAEDVNDDATSAAKKPNNEIRKLLKEIECITIDDSEDEGDSDDDIEIVFERIVPRPTATNGVPNNNSGNGNNQDHSFNK